MNKLKPVVYILSGYKTKTKSVKLMKNIYEKHNISVKEYSINGINVFKPKYFINESKKIIKEIENEDKPFFLHSNSAGYFNLCEINSKLRTPPLGNIIESGPGVMSSSNIQETIYRSNKIWIPSFAINYWLNKHGINEWNINRYEKIKDFPNKLILFGKNDKILDLNYVNEYVQKSQYQPELFFFEKSGHGNIQKKEPEIYEKVLSSYIEKNIANLSQNNENL